MSAASKNISDENRDFPFQHFLTFGQIFIPDVRNTVYACRHTSHLSDMVFKDEKAKRKEIKDCISDVQTKVFQKFSYTA